MTNNRSFASSLRDALQWRLLLLWTLGVLLPTAILSWPVWRQLAAILDQSPRALEIARRFDMLAMEDVAVAVGRSMPALGGGMVFASLIAILLAPLLSGMTLTAARSGEELGIVALLQGAIGWYGRMFRLFLVSLVPLAVAGGLAALFSKLAEHSANHARLESHADRVHHLATAMTILVFVVVHATVEAARAQYAADETLRGGWRAWIRGLKLVAKKPVPLFACYIGLTAIAWFAAALLALLRLHLVPAGAVFWPAFIVTQLAVAAIGWGRISRLFALTSLARER